MAIAAAMVHGPRPAAARRADLAARPGGRRRARLAAAAPQRGLGHGRGDRRAPARALPAGRRPGDRAGGRARRLRRRRRASYLAWATDATPALATPAARLFSLAGLRRRPVTVKEARAALRARVRIARPRRATRPSGRARRCAGCCAATSGPSRRSRCAASGSRSRTARPCCAALDLELRAGRAGGADGPQRRGQEHAAAAGQGPRRAHARARRARRARWRCCCRTPATT